MATVRERIRDMRRGDSGDTGAFLLPDEPGRLIPILERRWREGVAFRRPYDRQALINHAFYENYQWLQELQESRVRDETTLRRIPVTDDPDAPVMLTFNLIGKFVDRAVAELTERNPRIEGRPVSNEDDDVQTAYVVTALSASEDARMEIETLIPSLYYQVVLSGWAYLDQWWDPDAGDFVGHDPDDGTRMLFKGNLRADILSHLQVVLDPMACSAADARWGIVTTAMTADEIAERYDTVPEEPVAVKSLADTIASIEGPGYDATSPKRYAVRQFRLPPGRNRSQPGGMIFTWCGKTALERRRSGKDAGPQPWPYKKLNRLPISQFNFLPPTKGYFGRTFVKDQISPQEAFNAAISTEVDLSQRLFPKGFYDPSGFNPAESSARVEWLPYDSQGGVLGPPSPWQMDAAWAQQFEIVQKNCREFMQERFGMNEAASGNLAGTTPGVTALALQEAAQKPFAIPAKELVRGLKNFGLNRILMIQQFWDERRIVRTWSRAGTQTVRELKGSDLSGQFDIHISIESAAPRSKSAHAQMALEFFKAGVPGMTVRALRQILDVPVTDIGYEDLDEDVRQAERENDRIVEEGGKLDLPSPLDPPQVAERKQAALLAALPQPLPWHNHAEHIATHTSFMKTTIFERLPDKVKALFDVHVAAHQALQMQQMVGAQLQQGAAPTGSPAPSLAGPNGQPLPTGSGVPAVTELGLLGGRAGQPGAVPGMSPDQVLGAIGR